MTSPVILVTGGRDFNNKSLLFDTLDDVTNLRGWMDEDEMLPIVYLITGDAKGADTLAVDWAVVNYVPYEIFIAHWASYGLHAGGERNQWMLDKGKPDLVVAFPTKKSKGTWDMVRRAKKAGVEVMIVEDKD